MLIMLYCSACFVLQQLSLAFLVEDSVAAEVASDYSFFIEGVVLPAAAANVVHFRPSVLIIGVSLHSVQSFIVGHSWLHLLLILIINKRQWVQIICPQFEALQFSTRLKLISIYSNCPRWRDETGNGRQFWPQVGGQSTLLQSFNRFWSQKTFLFFLQAIVEIDKKPTFPRPMEIIHLK